MSVITWSTTTTMANKTYLVIELPIRNDKATELLNRYAAEGWRVTAVVASFLTTTQVILERDA